jgi:hypothetical protein
VRFGLSKWQPKHLLAAWSAYWLALLLWGVGSALPVFWRISRPDAKGSASFNFGDKGFELTLMEGAVTAWHGAISFRSVLFLCAVPPLVLWAFWLRAQRRERHADGPALVGAPLDQPHAASREGEPSARESER